MPDLPNLGYGLNAYGDYPYGDYNQAIFIPPVSGVGTAVPTANGVGVIALVAFGSGTNE